MAATAGWRFWQLTGSFCLNDGYAGQRVDGWPVDWITCESHFPRLDLQRQFQHCAVQTAFCRCIFNNMHLKMKKREFCFTILNCTIKYCASNTTAWCIAMVIISDSHRWEDKMRGRGKEKKKCNFWKKINKKNYSESWVNNKKKRERIKGSGFFVWSPTSVASLCAHYVAAQYHLLSTTCLLDRESRYWGDAQAISSFNQGSSKSTCENMKSKPVRLIVWWYTTVRHLQSHPLFSTSYW